MKKLFAEFPDNKVLLLLTSNPYLLITREKQDRFSGVKPGLIQLKIPSLKKPGHSINTYTLQGKERERWLNIGGKPLWEERVRKIEARGNRDAQKILDTTLELLEQ